MNLLALLAEQSSGTGAEQPKGNNTQTIIMWVILIVVIVAFFVWSTISNKKRQKQEQEKLASIKVGDKVKTIGGVCGYIVELNDEENTFVVETGYGDKKSYIKFDKQAIYQTASPVEETATEEEKAEEKVEETTTEEPADKE